MSGARIEDRILDDIRARIPLSSIVGRDVALKRRGREYTGLCPFHAEKTGSFTVSDAKGFFHCFGCGAHGDVIGYTMRRHGVDFRQAVADLGRDCGIEIDDVGPRSAEQERAVEARRAALAAERAALQRDAEEERRNSIERARQIWRERRPVDDSPVETYLRGRLIDPARLPRFVLADGAPAHTPAGWPLSLGFHPALFHADTRTRQAGMIAPNVDVAGRLIGLHRTFLKADGSDKLDGQAKKMLGDVSGGCIRLAPIAARMVAGEGIETTLSVMLSTQLGGLATISLGNLAGQGDAAAQARAPRHPTRLTKEKRPLQLPTTVPDMAKPGFAPPPGLQQLLFAEDNDNGDPESADALMRRAANRFARLGLAYAPFRAPEGMDWQDVARQQAGEGRAA